MRHPYANRFNQPADPVALCDPDYFDIISNPMDLGTVKTKISKGLYATVDEFETDVRLTFSNAMRYYPVDSPFYNMAKEMNSVFSEQYHRFVLSDNKKVKDSMRIDFISNSSTSNSGVTEETTIGQKKLKNVTDNSKVKGSKPVESISEVASIKSCSGVLNSNPTNSTAKREGKVKKMLSSSATSDSIKAPAYSVPVGAKSSVEIEIDPAKAKRVERLKRRFADTISKAEKTLVCPVQVKKQKTEDGIKSDKDDQVKKFKTEQGMNKGNRDCNVERQREREASRIALEKMKRTVEFEDNISILTDLACIIGDYSFSGPLRGYGGNYVNRKVKSPLESLGLRLKKDDHEYEEGEIIF